MTKEQTNNWKEDLHLYYAQIMRSCPCSDRPVAEDEAKEMLVRLIELAISQEKEKWAKETVKAILEVKDCPRAEELIGKRAVINLLQRNTFPHKHLPRTN